VSDVQRLPHLSAGEQDEVRALADRLAAEYGSPQLNDESLARLGTGGVTHLLLRTGSARLAGYAQLAGADAELAADQAAAGPLLDAVEAAAVAELAIWTHGARSPLAGLLEQRGYRCTRLLHQLRRPGGLAVPDVALPAEVTVRPFAVGRDEDAWLAVNAAAFAEHAEQGAWTRADLAAREAEDWFDPAGFFLAEGSLRPEHGAEGSLRPEHGAEGSLRPEHGAEGSLRPEHGPGGSLRPGHERWHGNALLGFHWTKVHPDGAGEVYVLGVAPAAQGLRLGAGLLAIGLRHLRERGCPFVLLYVDDANAAAVRLYERFGFARHDRDAQWSRPRS
jgi:mycothiol synthase